MTLDNSPLATLKLESGSYLQPDTEAQSNVVPLHLHKKATRDFNRLNVAPVGTAIISYYGTSIPILGRVRLRVWRGDFRCLLDPKFDRQQEIQAYIWQESVSWNENHQVLGQRSVESSPTGHLVARCMRMMHQSCLLSPLTS